MSMLLIQVHTWSKRSSWRLALRKPAPNQSRSTSCRSLLMMPRYDLLAAPDRVAIRVQDTTYGLKENVKLRRDLGLGSQAFGPWESRTGKCLELSSGKLSGSAPPPNRPHASVSRIAQSGRRHGELHAKAMEHFEDLVERGLAPGANAL